MILVRIVTGPSSKYLLSITVMLELSSFLLLNIMMRFECNGC